MTQTYTDTGTVATKDYAKKYIEMGLRVVPIYSIKTPEMSCTCQRAENCTTPGKHPIVSNWQDWAKENCTVELIEKNWIWEKSNIGIVTGKISGVFVIDLDPKHDGIENFKEWEKKNVEIATPWRVLTGSGGYHLYLAYPGELAESNSIQLTNKVGALTGVDMKSDGGFVVAPPSIHKSGKEYVWEM